MMIDLCILLPNHPRPCFPILYAIKENMELLEAYRTSDNVLWRNVLKGLK